MDHKALSVDETKKLIAQIVSRDPAVFVEQITRGNDDGKYMGHSIGVVVYWVSVRRVKHLMEIFRISVLRDGEDDLALKALVTT